MTLHSIKYEIMIWILLVFGLVILNVLLLKFSCNDCETKAYIKKPKLNMPEKNDLINQPSMADK
jgi:hypothetical protein